LVPASAKFSLPRDRSDGVGGVERGDIVKVGTIQRAIDLLAPVQRAIGLEPSGSTVQALKAQTSKVQASKVQT
ncbi:MAG: hypothetical protein ACKO3W_14340, partial [bacterium]